MKKKKALHIIILILCLAVILGLLQRLLIPKYISENEEGRLAAEYYSYAGNNDVLFVGDCEVYSNFSPVTMWQEYGFTSAIRGTPSQTVWQSYYILEDMLRYEDPKIVVFNVFSMSHDKAQSEAFNRLAIDGMRWSSSKVGAIKASMTDEESFASYIFPILRFHSRWSELTAEDVKYMFRSEKLSHNGYVMRADTKPVTVLPDPIPRADYSFGEIDWTYLEKMRKLCENRGIQLVLIKSASCYPHWFDQWDEQIKDYAQKNGLLYVNFLENQAETGIDYSTDTYDAGMHLNVSGAEKCSVWFGKILAEQPRMEDRRSDSTLADTWKTKTEYYEAMKASLYNQLEKGIASSGNN